MTSGQENTENATEPEVIGISRDGACGEFSKFFDDPDAAFFEGYEGI